MVISLVYHLLLVRVVTVYYLLLLSLTIESETDYNPIVPCVLEPSSLYAHHYKVSFFLYSVITLHNSNGCNKP